MTPGDGLPRPPPSLNKNPVHPLPGNPRKCPQLSCRVLRFPSVFTRDLHYPQDHILKAPKRRSSLKKDSGNYDGILGKKKHILEPEKLCLEPESYTGERIPKEDYSKLMETEKLVDRIWRKLGKKG